jgi:hypothetical protein
VPLRFTYQDKEGKLLLSEIQDVTITVEQYQSDVSHKIKYVSPLNINTKF